ncbi:MAG: N-acetylmuramoyl-L-alanine amidase [Proteobacteria bacterium]|nr:N-acetylmuramoyl-L-alanine amidase [Pseudomonadota bacterium]
MSRSGKIFMVLLLWIFGSLWSTSALALNQILNIRHWVAPDHTRVVIDTSEDCTFTVEKAERKVVIDLNDTDVPSHIPSMILLNKPGVEGVALSPRPPSGVRVLLSVPGQVQTTVFNLKKIQDKPFRIVIDIVLPEVAKKESEARERIKITRKDRIIVIDPGHGGDAPGAVGRRKTLEKDVVLSISRKLRDVLNRKEGYRAFLTRDGDYYVSFNKRLMIAREYGADLFVSIHADAAKNRKAEGSSVYILSTGAASSEAAKILAQNENLADIVGGVHNGESSDDSDPIILDMFQTHTINQSRTFGAKLLKHLEGANPLKFASVQEAPFRVLKLPEIPSILIETAYISNPKEEKLLRSDRFRGQIAEAVGRSVVEFLPPLPPVAVLVSEGKGKSLEKRAGEGEERRKEEEESAYRVKKGDTLGKIARSHNTSIAVLLKLNAMKLHDFLPVGRLLKLPSAKAERRMAEKQTAAGKPSGPKNAATRVYLIKRGDTLSGIARRHGTTIRVLMELNHLKGSEPLHVDRKLILPGKSSL